MLKLERDSSIHMLPLCSESSVVLAAGAEAVAVAASSWQDMRLSSSRSSGGGEMFSTVRRLEGVSPALSTTDDADDATAAAATSADSPELPGPPGPSSARGTPRSREPCCCCCCSGVGVAGSMVVVGQEEPGSEVVVEVLLPPTGLEDMVLEFAASVTWPTDRHTG